MRLRFIAAFELDERKRGEDSVSNPLHVLPEHDLLATIVELIVRLSA
jgi:hypothetical protein